MLDGSGKAVLFKNVYAYTFATPNGYRTANADNVCDNNIMNIVRTIKMSKAEHDVMKKFCNLMSNDAELDSYSFSEIFGDVLAPDNTCRTVFNIEYTDEE